MIGIFSLFSSIFVSMFRRSIPKFVFNIKSLFHLFFPPAGGHIGGESSAKGWTGWDFKIA